MRIMNSLSDATVLEICLKYNDGSLEMEMTPRRWG